MASAWGDSWGSAWGDSWGSVVTPVVVSDSGGGTSDIGLWTVKTAQAPERCVCNVKLERFRVKGIALAARSGVRADVPMARIRFSRFPMTVATGASAAIEREPLAVEERAVQSQHGVSVELPKEVTTVGKEMMDQLVKQRRIMEEDHFLLGV